MCILPGGFGRCSGRCRGRPRRCGTGVSHTDPPYQARVRPIVRAHSARTIEGFWGVLTKHVFAQLSGRTMAGQLGGSWGVLVYQQAEAEAVQPTCRTLSVGISVYSTRWLWQLQRKMPRKTAKMRHRCQPHASPQTKQLSGHTVPGQLKDPGELMRVAGGDPCGAACLWKQLSGHTLARQLRENPSTCSTNCPCTLWLDSGWDLGHTLAGRWGDPGGVLSYWQSKAEAVQPTRSVVSDAVFVYSTRWLWKVERKVARKTIKIQHRCQAYIHTYPRNQPNVRSIVQAHYGRTIQGSWRFLEVAGGLLWRSPSLVTIVLAHSGRPIGRFLAGSGGPVEKSLEFPWRSLRAWWIPRECLAGSRESMGVVST